MRLLLDTHAAAWWWNEDSRLPDATRRAISTRNNTTFVSAVAAWEMANKHRLGKWPAAGVLADRLDALMADASFQPLPVTVSHARLAGRLEGSHRDPFDRMLAAQGLSEALTIVSADPVFRDFGLPVLWS